MNRRNLLIASVLVLGIVATAHAVKQMVSVRPANAQANGFKVSAQPRDDNLIRFNVARDLTKARKHEAGSGLTIDRTAVLTVYGEGGPIVRCRLEPLPQDKPVLSYEFDIAKEFADSAFLTVSEIDDYADPAKRGRLIGGGTYFEFKLSGFAAE